MVIIVKVIEVKDFLEDKDEYRVLSIEKLKQNLNELEIDNIELGDGVTYKLNDKIVTYLYNDYDNPLVIRYDDIFDKNTLYVNKDWYLGNQDICDELFDFICSNLEKESFTINSSIIINDKLIDSLCLNKNLKSITLAYFDDKPYSLTMQDYLKFKKSSIKQVETKLVDEELRENFDELIMFNKKRKLISFYNYEKLQELLVLGIYSNLTDKEIFNLKYVAVGTVLKFGSDSYDCISKAILELKKLNKSNKVVIEVEDKLKFNDFYLNSGIEYNNLFVRVDGIDYTVRDYFNFEKTLYNLISDAKDLSNFEKYIYAYNVAKSFKKYKENYEDKSASRNLYSILINNYMVCVGFSNMFGDLLDKLGIGNDYLSVNIDVSYDDIVVDEENFLDVKKVEYGGHARRMVYLVDDKYGIDGFYVADPTWDNSIEEDYYNHLILTNNEVLEAKRYLWINTFDSSELFYVNSLEEYTDKINFLLSREKNTKELKNLMWDLITFKLKKLDRQYIDSLKEKYEYLNKGIYSWPDDINDLVYELGVYLVSHVNKEVSGEIIMSAVRNVYKKVYDYYDDELDIKMNEIIEYNKERQKLAFPVRYNVNEDGTKEVVLNSLNKFDFDYVAREK